MRSPAMIRIKQPRRSSRAFIFCLITLIGLRLASGPAWAGVGANPPAGNPDDYAGGDWLGTAAVDNYTNDGTVSGDVLLDAGNDVFINNGRVTGTVRGQNWHDQLTNNAGGQIDGNFRGDNGNDTLINYGTIGGTINGGNHNDTIENHGTADKILGITGTNTISNSGTVFTDIKGGDGNDTVTNSGSVGGRISGEGGNDTITNNGSVSAGIVTSDGNDTIINNGSVGTGINAGGGVDSITINGSVGGNVYGMDGNDTITVNGRVDGDICGDEDNDWVILKAGASVGGSIRGGVGTNTVTYDNVPDTGAFTLTNFTQVEYIGTNGMSGSQDVSGIVMTVRGSLRLQSGTLNPTLMQVAGGTLAGNGSVTSDVVVSLAGSVAPGNSIGAISVNSINLPGGTNFNVELKGASADRLIVATDVVISGANLNLTLLGAPYKNSKYTIIRKDGAGAVNGAFAGLAEGATLSSGGHQFSITYAGGDGNDVVLTALTGVNPPTGDDTEPEPDPNTLPAPLVEQGSGPSPAGSRDGSQLSWPLVKGATHYRVYRADCPNCRRKEIGRVKGNSFVDNTAEAGRPYYYWLRTENSDGLGVYSNWMAAWRYEQNPGRAGDFNGDGIMDLLWWDPASNQLSIWFMNCGAVQSVSPPGDGLNVAEWLLIATGDFNGDGACDLLWWRPETGETRIWFLDRAMAAAGGAGEWLVKSSADLETMTGHALIAHAGDVNGDGISDILWRDYSNGDVTLWLMGADGRPQLSGPPTPASDDITGGGRPGLSGGLQWQVAGLGDANADHKADVVWKDARNNRLAIWLMDGSMVSQAVDENKGQNTVWRAVGVGDLNRDGQVDMVWRNEASGEVKAWLMEAGKFSEERGIIPGSGEATQWQVKAVGDFCVPGCDDLYCKHSESSEVRVVTLDGQTFAPSAP